MRFGPTMLVVLALTAGCRECRNPSQPHTTGDEQPRDTAEPGRATDAPTPKRDSPPADAR